MALPIGFKHTEETKRKIGNVHKGRQFSPSTQFKKGHIGYKAQLGKPLSEEVRKKISESAKKKWQNPKYRKHMTEVHRGQRTGKNNNRWKGGITSENIRIRNSFEMKEWKRAVFKRDNFTCQRCGGNGGVLVAHHINNFSEFPEIRTAIDNGITLCKNCHLEFHKKYGRKNNTKEQLEEFLICNIQDI